MLSEIGAKLRVFLGILPKVPDDAAFGHALRLVDGFDLGIFVVEDLLDPIARVVEHAGVAALNIVVEGIFIAFGETLGQLILGGAAVDLITLDVLVFEAAFLLNDAFDLLTVGGDPRFVGIVEVIEDSDGCIFVFVLCPFALFAEAESVFKVVDDVGDESVSTIRAFCFARDDCLVPALLGSGAAVGPQFWLALGYLC